jgi:hypothetical protein
MRRGRGLTARPRSLFLWCHRPELTCPGDIPADPAAMPGLDPETPPNWGKVGVVGPVGVPPEPPAVLKPLPNAPKLPGCVAKPPDPPAELDPKIPVEFVGPVGIPPEPPEVLVPKLPIWALAGTVPASSETAKQVDAKIVRTTHFRSMKFSIQFAFLSPSCGVR